MERFRRSRRIMGKRLGLTEGEEEIGTALEQISRVEKILGWMPPSGRAGTGTTSEGSKRMSRGGPP